MNKLNYYQLNQIEHLWKDLLSFKGSRVDSLLNQMFLKITYVRTPHITFLEHHTIYFKYLLEDLIGLYFEDSLPHFDTTGHIFIQRKDVSMVNDVNFLLDMIESYLDGVEDTPIGSIRLYTF